MKLTRSTWMYEGKRYYSVIWNDNSPCMADTTEIQKADAVICKEIESATKSRQFVNVYEYDGDKDVETFLFSTKDRQAVSL